MADKKKKTGGVILDRSLHINPYTEEGKKAHDQIMRETLEALGAEVPEDLKKRTDAAGHIDIDAMIEKERKEREGESKVDVGDLAEAVKELEESLEE